MEPVKETCRFCMEPTQIFTDSIFSDQMRPILRTVFSFELNEEKHLPTGICPDCYSKISAYHDFHETVRLNENRLQTTIIPNETAYIKQEYLVLPYCSEDKLNDTTEQIDLADNEATPPEMKVESEESSSSEEEPPKRQRRKRKIETPKVANKRIEEKFEEAQKKLEKQQEENKKIGEFFAMTCEYCSEKFDTFLDLQRHSRKEHNARGSIKCCNKVIYKRRKVLDHIDSHLNPEKFRCDICQKSYSSKHYLDLHNLKIHSVDQPFKCEKCEQRFPKEYLLKAHLVTHVQAECNICNKVLASVNSLRNHISIVHNGESKRICDTCGQQFRTKLAMEKHIKVHMGINPIQRVQCHICSKWVNGKTNLRMHIKTVHNEKNGPVLCDICNQQYPNHRAMYSHKQRVHVEEKFECEFCGKKFKRKIYLKEHRASHTGEALYSCDLCGMTTNSNANLYSHKKSKHPDEWLEARKKALALAYG
ncbi:transcription factor grauzone-like [Uranotaenia lowii]|uniref:transcription factor grauzone-like n=1 Tax=Uranotaenia lowii TaxID=190385 RepID=UPI0024791D00|nr:transcription factor grauzone-like [Uranotaenia lowii]